MTAKLHKIKVRELEDLIDIGVDINAYGGKCNLLLAFAKWFGDSYCELYSDVEIRIIEQSIRVLLENDANPDLVSDEIYAHTSLGYVLDAHEKSWKICRLLVSHGADVNAVYSNSLRKPAIYLTYDSDWSGWGRVNKHMWLRMFVEAGADPMKCIWERRGSAMLEHIFFMTDFVEEVFMLDFYIEN